MEGGKYMETIYTKSENKEYTSLLEDGFMPVENEE